MLNGESLKNVDDFFYLGSWIDCCSKVENVRIRKAWSALYNHDAIWESWKSKLSGGLKIGFFQGIGWNGLPVRIDGLDIDAVSRQKAGRGIYKNAER